MIIVNERRDILVVFKIGVFVFKVWKFIFFIIWILNFKFMLWIFLVILVNFFLFLDEGYLLGSGIIFFYLLIILNFEEFGYVLGIFFLYYR